MRSGPQVRLAGGPARLGSGRPGPERAALAGRIGSAAGSIGLSLKLGIRPATWVLLSLLFLTFRRDRRGRRERPSSLEPSGLRCRRSFRQGRA